MKKVVLLILFAVSSLNVSAKNVLQIKDKPIIEQKADKVDPAKVCRYYAIVEAGRWGEYGSPSWQIAYSYYYDDCMGR